eukprot:758411-Hanusia_phi.AAC.1
MTPPLVIHPGGEKGRWGYSGALRHRSWGGGGGEEWPGEQETRRRRELPREEHRRSSKRGMGMRTAERCGSFSRTE